MSPQEADLIPEDATHARQRVTFTPASGRSLGLFAIAGTVFRKVGASQGANDRERRPHGGAGLPGCERKFVTRRLAA
jgi:hypothetical protein